MKILLDINEKFYNKSFSKEADKEIKSNNSFCNREVNKDIITFSSKKYSIECIKHPTNHCGYCGCKVYTEEQIIGIAKEMLALKSGRLQGKIKSVIEKLDSAKYSEEITLAKRIENESEIEFFKNFMEISTKKPYLRGEDIFEQVYKQSTDEAINTLKRNMRPLLCTIDHISPQNQKENNNNSDINLVEACYCCNHDLKKGVSFNDFYTMFPSIEKNMPRDKFKYALSHVLKNSQSAINKNLSSENLLKSMQRLLMQRTEIINNLKLIDQRILDLKLQIKITINSLKQDISKKNIEITNLRIELQEAMKIPELKAAFDIEQLKEQLKNEDTVILSLNERYGDISNKINNLKNPRKTSKKNNTNIEINNKKQKIEELKKLLEDIRKNIIIHKQKKSNIENKLAELNKEFPNSIQYRTHKMFKIPQMIKSLEAEIEMLTQTIIELENQRKNIPKDLLTK